MRLLTKTGDWRPWEAGLLVAVGALFAAAAAANVGPLFFGGGDTSIPGAIFSYLYLAAWVLAACLLRDRAGWVYAAFAVRWAAALSAALSVATLALDGDGPFSIACVMLYAVFVSVYGGLFSAAWIYYLLLLVQAAVASLLLFRLRRRWRREEETEGYYTWD